MPGKILAKRYAQAAFEIAVDRGDPEQWEGSLSRISEALEAGELRAFLNNAKIPLAEKVQTIRSAFPDTDAQILNLLSLLVARGKADQMADVLAAYHQLLDQHRGREQAEMVSAVPLEDQEQQQVVSFLQDLIHKDVVLQSKVDPSILAGLVIKVGNKLIDGSARSRLQQMGKNIRTGPVAG